MPYTQFIHEHVMFVRWTSSTVSDLDAVLRDARAVQAKTKRKLLYAGVQYDDFIEPDAEVRKAVLPMARALTQISSVYYVALCASGVRAVLHRSLMRGLSVTARIAGYDTSMVRIVDSVEQILTEQEHDLPKPRNVMRKMLMEAGMMS